MEDAVTDLTRCGNAPDIYPTSHAAKSGSWPPRSPPGPLASASSASP
jgi:hypothetical protein